MINMNAGKIEIIQADITKLDADAIVNAANHSLLGGGGVDGAIHRAAGPELLAYNRGLGGCKTGDAKTSPGFRLKAKYIIHTVGPVWSGGHSREDELLRSCYIKSLEEAVKHDCRTVAIPSISTGVYGFPFERACSIALAAVDQFLSNNPSLQKVYLVAFGDTDFRMYSHLYKEYFNSPR